MLTIAVTVDVADFLKALCIPTSCTTLLKLGYISQFEHPTVLPPFHGPLVKTLPLKLPAKAQTAYSTGSRVPLAVCWQYGAVRAALAEATDSILPVLISTTAVAAHWQ